MTDGSVCLAYLHDRQVAHSWHASMLGLLTHDGARLQRVTRGGVLAAACRTGALAEARNAAVERFLGSDAEWLLWVDTDMGFGPDSLERLIAVADPVERPIVGGLCFRLRDVEPDGMGGHRTVREPTLLEWTEDGGEHGYLVHTEYPSGLVEVDATGAAFILIHRDVLAKIRETDGPHWYSQITVEPDGALLSEDLSFCRRATGLGFPVFVDTRVKTTHLKWTWVGEDHG